MIAFRRDSSLSRTITLASVIVLASVMFVSAGSFLSVAPMTTVQYAAAQVEGEHGLGLTKVCQKVALDENNTCTFTARNIDDFGDSLTLNDAQDTMLAPYPGAPVTHTMSGGAQIEIIAITDNLPAGDTTCTVGGSLPCVIGPNDRVQFRDTSFVMSVAGNIPDTAAVSWTDRCDAQGTVACDPNTAQSATAGSTTTVINPSISVVKSLNTTKVLSGQPIEVTANVTNTGNTQLTGLTAVDSEAGALDCDATTLAAGESTLCTGTFNPVASGSNTVNATANHQVGSVSDTDSEDFTVVDASISVVKSLNTTKIEAGSAIEVTANVTNTGGSELTGLTATDSEAGTLTCDVTTLAPGESTDCTGIFTPAQSGTNTVTATANFQLGEVSDEDSEDFTIINPSITVEKTCDPQEQTAPGTITWTITTTNNGDVSLDVIVTDTRHGTTFNGTLAAGESNVTSIVESGLGAGSYTDEATASGEHQLGTVEGTDSATCSVEAIPLIGYTVGGGRVNAPSSALPPDGNNGKSFIVTHGFELHCDRTQTPNMLQVNWLGNSFHLERVDTVLCEDNFAPTKAPPEPKPGPATDTYIAEGTGRYNGECGATVEFILTDQGEPGKKDQIVLMKIWDKNGTPVLDITSPLNLQTGNHQWTPHPATHHHSNLKYGPCAGEI